MNKVVATIEGKEGDIIEFTNTTDQTLTMSVDCREYGVVLLDLPIGGALLHKSLRHVRLSPMGQGASMRNDAESIHVPVPSTQLVRLQSGADRQGASDLLVR